VVTWRSLVALGALVVVGLVMVPREVEPPRPAPARERILILRPAAGLGAVAAGLHDVWIDDRARRRLIRVDGRSGRVRTALRVDGRLALAAGRDAVWALQSGGGYGSGLRGPLLRVDPHTNRVRARIPLRDRAHPAALGFGVLAAAHGVWVWGPQEILAVDPARGRVRRRIATSADWGELTGLGACAGRLVAATADGHLLSFDTRSGARAGFARVPMSRPAVRATLGDRVVLTAGGEVALADPSSGRLRWRRHLGFRVGMAVGAGGVLWVHSASERDPGDRLTGLDPTTGRVLTTGVLPLFGTTGLVAARGRLWMPSADGDVAVVAPLAG
jgi:outer membrane protein assembly factor BamB